MIYNVVETHIACKKPGFTISLQTGNVWQKLEVPRILEWSWRMFRTLLLKKVSTLKSITQLELLTH